MTEGVHRAFATLVGDLEDGALHDELSRAVPEIVAQLHDILVQQGGKPKAKLTLTLGFVLDSGVIEVKGEVKVALPELRRGKTIFYATPDNSLTRRHPKQQELPLRDVNRPVGEARSV